MKLSEKRFINYPNFKETYTIGGSTPVKGQIFKNKFLANTFRVIAKEGRKGFYEGPVGDD